MDLRARIGLLVQAQGARSAAQDINGVAAPVKKLGNETETAGRKMRDAERQALSFRRGLIGMTSFVTAGAAGIFGLGAVLHGAADEYEKTWKATQATNAVIASTGGAANISAKGVTELSDSLALKAGIDNEAIQQGENLLLTFRAIRNEAGLGNDIFNQTTAAAVDMSAAFKAAGKSMDVSEAALQLGKALNDPAKGMSRLMRVGVSFTQQQIDQAKALQKSGDVMGAQKIILAELTKEFGGAAAATASPFDKARVAWHEAERTLGTALAPALVTVTDDFTAFMTEAQKGVGTGGKVVQTVKDIWSVVSALSPVLIGLTAAFVAYKGVLIATAVAERIVAAVELVQTFIAAAAATDLMTASMIALDMALDANPVVLAVAAIVGLGAALVLAYHKVGWFRNGVNSVFSWIKGHWPLLAGIFTGGLVPAIALVVKHFGQIKEAFRDAINFVIKGWNSLQFKIPGFHVGPVHFGGTSLGVPKIPLLANGGDIAGAGMAVVGDAGPELVDLPQGARVTPLPSQPVALGGGSDSRVVQLEIPVYLDGRKVGSGVRRVALGDLLASSAA